MKHFLWVLFISLSITCSNAEFLHFVDKIDPDADCETIKRAHPEMKIVCQDHTRSPAKESEDESQSEQNSDDFNPKAPSLGSSKPATNLIKPFESKNTIDSISQEEDQVKETLKQFEKFTSGPSFSLDSSINDKFLGGGNSTQNQKKGIVESGDYDLDSMLKNIEETTKKTGVDPQLNDLLKKINPKDFLTLDNEHQSENKIVNKGLEKQSKNQIASTLPTNVPINNPSLSSKSIKSAIEKPDFPLNPSPNGISKRTTGEFIFKEKSSHINDLPLEDQISDTQPSEFPTDTDKSKPLSVDLDPIKSQLEDLRKSVLQINNNFKALDPEKTFSSLNSRLKQSIESAGSNVKEGLEKKIEVLQRSVAELQESQNKVLNQIQDLTQNQKNLLKFLQNSQETQKKGISFDDKPAKKLETSQETEFKRKFMDVFFKIKSELHEIS